MGEETFFYSHSQPCLALPRILWDMRSIYLIIHNLGGLLGISMSTQFEFDLETIELKSYGLEINLEARHVEHEQNVLAIPISSFASGNGNRREKT